MTQAFRRGVFRLETDPIVNGWTDDTTWNGFANVWIALDECDRYAAELRKHKDCVSVAVSTETGFTLLWRLCENDPWESGPPVEIETPEGRLLACYFGGGAGCFQEIEADIAP